DRGQNRGDAARHRRTADRALADAARRTRRRHQGELRSRRGAHRQARQPRPAGVACQGQRHGAALRRAHARGLRRVPTSIRDRHMTPFELVEPASLGEAIALLDPEDAGVRPIAGGTALMLMMKAGVFRPTRLVSLRAIKPLCAIVPSSDGSLTIGAMTPLTMLEHDADVRRHAPVITRTLRTLSNVR